MAHDDIDCCLEPLVPLLAWSQEIRMHNHTTGGQDLTLRMWNRIPMTNEHLAALGQA